MAWLSSRARCPTRQASLDGGRSRRRSVARERNPAGHNAGQAHPAGHIVPEVAGRGLAVRASAARAFVLRGKKKLVSEDFKADLADTFDNYSPKAKDKRV